MKKHKVRLTIRQHNELFRHRQVKLLTYYEIIDNPQNRDIEMRKYTRLPVRIIYILLSPIAILFGGIPMMIGLVKECLSGKDIGADSINRDWFYSELNKINHS